MRGLRIIAIAVFSIFIFASCQQQTEPQAKYVFLFIGDGMGLAHVNAAEAFQSAVSGKEYTPLSFRQFPQVGLNTTFAANRLITGSAASGTALASGSKTNINFIGLDEEGLEPLESIAHKAKGKGMKVGIISSVSIDHATPAAFYAHQPHRNMNFEIGLDLLESRFDFFGGGGFLKPDGILNGNAVNLITLARDKGFLYVNSKDGFEALKPSGEPVIFVNPELTSGASMYFAIDQQEDYITLADITAKAIEYLDNDKGFFMMVEGGKIDWVAHANDIASVVYEVTDFSDAVEEAVKFYRQHPDETLIVVTSDHETGGLALGNQKRQYETNMGLLANQKQSGEAFNESLKTWRANYELNDEGFEALMNLVHDGFGIGEGGAIELNPGEKEAYKDIMLDYDNYSKGDYGTYSRVTLQSTAILGERAGIGWTSSTHTAIAVPVYSLGVNCTAFSGNLDNTDIPKIIWDIVE